MQNPNRMIDRTHLSIDQAEARGFIHRDYLAHCLRWSHVVKFLMRGHRYKSDIILDIGCGKDLPLPRLMYANKMTDFAYVGVDMNPLTMPEMLATAVKNGKADVQLLGGHDASKLTYEQLEFKHPTIAVCFEVLEHVHPSICKALVRNVYDLLADGGDAFFSTPVYNGSAAANHINEMRHDTVGALLEHSGFSIQAHYGTFASQSEIEPEVHRLAGSTVIWACLKEYYDSNVLSVIFAPLFPHASRNCIWHVKKTGVHSDKFPMAELLQRSLGQHKDAEELFT